MNAPHSCVHKQEEEPEPQKRRCYGESEGQQTEELACGRFKLTESNFELQAEPVTSPTPRLNTKKASAWPRMP